MNRITRIREARGLEPEQIALELGINTAWYYDLETGGKNWTDEISIAGLRNLCRILDVSPSSLLGVGDVIVTTPAELVELLKAKLETSGVSTREFSEKIGWNVDPLLRNPDELATFNADGLKSICDEVGIDWVGVLDTMRFDQL